MIRKTLKHILLIVNWLAISINIIDLIFIYQFTKTSLKNFSMGSNCISMELFMDNKRDNLPPIDKL